MFFRNTERLLVVSVGNQVLQGAVIAQLYERSILVNGWADTQLIGTAGCMILALVGAVAIRHTPEQVGCTPDGLPPPEVLKHEQRADEEESLLSDGDEHASDDTKGSSIRTETNVADADSDRTGDFTLHDALRTRALWILTLNAFCLCTVMAGSDLHLMSILEEGSPGITISPDAGGKQASIQ